MENGGNPSYIVTIPACLVNARPRRQAWRESSAGLCENRQSRLAQRKAGGAAAPPTFIRIRRLCRLKVGFSLEKPQTVEKGMLFHILARKMKLQVPKLASIPSHREPKVSKGRSESPLVASAGAKPFVSASIHAKLAKRMRQIPLSAGWAEGIEAPSAQRVEKVATPLF